ncbi:hypothetical protein HOE67_05225 [Candidatus Peregrinibacteria bacterium]|nr:hypothetical protein [Candidatus Peregrinibacteria bacterium]
MEAKPVLSGMDIVRELSLQPSLGLVGGDILPKKALQVLEAIPKTKPIDTEKLAKNTGLDLSDIIKYLSLLEIHLLIYSTNSGFYLRK